MKRLMPVVALIAAMLLPVHALAAVSREEAARLKTELTPVGAERGGNAGGAIPAWDGGLTVAPACFKGKGGRYCDPFAGDKPQFTITAQNLDKYRSELSVGHVAMFAKYPSFRMPVYATRRTAASPQFVYDATYANALKAKLEGNGEALHDAVVGVPFPIPKTGHEPIWNHKLRYRGESVRRWNNQFAVTATGGYNQVKIREDIVFNYSVAGMTPPALENVGIYFLQIVTAPARLAGTITLVHETMDQVAEPRRAWQYNPGARRLRRAPNVGYDNPGTASDGLRTNDQYDAFNGAMDRYTWKLVGKRELYVPYNNYRLHNTAYDELVRKNHLNPDAMRYELHRVWVVDSATKPGTTHIYKRRTFYVDEDSWAILLVDAYDRRDQLWRFQEAYSAMAYDKPFLAPVGESINDLQSGRYLAMSLNSEDAEIADKPYATDYFAPASVSKQVIK